MNNSLESIFSGGTIKGSKSPETFRGSPLTGRLESGIKSISERSGIEDVTSVSLANIASSLEYEIRESSITFTVPIHRINSKVLSFVRGVVRWKS